LPQHCILAYLSGTQLSKIVKGKKQVSPKQDVFQTNEWKEAR
jgi:hypothetical protein